ELAVDLDVGEVALVRRAEDGPTPWQQALDGVQPQRPGLRWREQALEAVLDADHAPAVLQLRRLDHRAEDGVETGRVAATGQDADPANRRCHEIIPPGAGGAGSVSLACLVFLILRMV